MIRVELGAGALQFELVGGARGPRQLEHTVEPGAHPAVLGRLLAHPLEAVDLLGDERRTLLRQVGAQLVELGAVLADDVVVALAELLVDRGELLAQQVVALLLVHPLGDVGADLGGDLQLGQVLAGPLGEQRHAGLHLHGVQHLGALLVAHLAPGGDGVGKRAGLGDRAQDLGQPAALAQLGDLLQHHPQLAGGGLDARAGAGVGEQLDFRVLGAALAGMDGHDPGAPLGLEDGGLLAVGQRGRVGDAGNDADLGTVGGGGTRRCREQHPAVAADGRVDRGTGRIVVERDGDDGARQHHGRQAQHRQERGVAHIGRAVGSRRGAGVAGGVSHAHNVAS